MSCKVSGYYYYYTINSIQFHGGSGAYSGKCEVGIFYLCAQELQSGEKHMDVPAFVF